MNQSDGKIIFNTTDADCSVVDWPCNHEPTVPVPAVVETRSRRKLYDYEAEAVQLFNSPEDAAMQADGKHRHAALVELFRGGYRILYWLDRDGNRWGRLGVSEQKLERAAPHKRLIYIIRNLAPSDAAVYVGQTRTLQTRMSGHLTMARRNRDSSEWYEWIAGVLDAGGSLRVDVVDAMRGTFYAAQQLEEIWRKIMILKGFKPYYWEAKMDLQTACLLENVPYYIAHRYRSCLIEPFQDRK
ncbi:GIY-YIG nuclease family protein [Haliangium sp.]|uniref:GIY-YIG nuclease family protein n=1 Tax=Haliangium sp. TaxID=2663208 RepID=UPI003D09E57C